MTSHRLRLNDLILSAGDEVAGDESGRWWWDVYGADFAMGEAEPVEVTMRTLLQDGARVVTTGYSNREVTFYAVVGGVDSSALAEGERQLALNLGRRGELGWTPPDGWGPETVFDIETSSMKPGGPDDDDLIEVQSTERVYQLRFVCQPFVRAAAMTVVPAIAVPTAALDEAVVDAGSSTARWNVPAGTLRDRGSFLDVIGTSSPEPTFVPLAPVSLAGRPYLSIVISGGGTPVCFINGNEATLVGSAAGGSFTLPDGTKKRATRWFFRTDETAIFQAAFAPRGTASRAFPLYFNSLRIRNLPPYSGTLRQSQRSIEVAGSVRTQGTLKVTAPEGGSLGTLVFYSTTTGLPAPSLRGYRISGANTPAPNTGAVSGYLELVDSGVTFELPASDLVAGKHQILARLCGVGGTRAVNWSARTYIGETAVGPAMSGSISVNLDLDEYRVVALGSADLPTTDLPEGSQATVRVVFSGGHRYDEAWLMNLDEGAVTVVEAGTHRRAWIETATTARPRPAIYIGDAEDRSDAFHDPLLIGAWGTHEFAPPLTTALVVTAACDGPAVEFEFYPRFMNFVADPAA